MHMPRFEVVTPIAAPPQRVFDWNDRGLRHVQAA
jgi:hypothetical protein